MRVCARARADRTLTDVISLGWAPCFSSRVTMSVWPCWAAWCSGVYPIWTQDRDQPHANANTNTSTAANANANANASQEIPRNLQRKQQKPGLSGGHTHPRLAVDVRLLL